MQKGPIQNATLPFPTVASIRTLDRVAVSRADADLVALHYAKPTSRVLLMADLKVSLKQGLERENAALHWIASGALADLGLEPEETIFLGLDEAGHARFVEILGAAQTATHKSKLSQFEPLADLRTLAVEAALAPDELSIVGAARSLAAWHRSHRCCGRCGARTLVRDAGWRRTCWACGQSIFPRSDPAVIMLISDRERCLLGRHSGFREGFYSVLAGFVEPGEDIEDAVRRETFEESGIVVGRVDYLGSQPWPFPHSLMIGCWGEALSSTITCDENELEDVRWFSRNDVRQMIAGEHREGIDIPGKLSIARALIDHFAADKTS